MGFYKIAHRIDYKASKNLGGYQNGDIYTQYVRIGVTADSMTLSEADRLSEEHMQEFIERAKKEDPEFHVISKMNHSQLRVIEYNEEAEKDPNMAELIEIVCHPTDKDKARLGFRGLTTKTIGWMKKHGLMETCSRCGGSGHYSYCDMYGTRCFKCAGSGLQMPRITKKLKSTIKALVEKSEGRSAECS